MWPIKNENCQFSAEKDTKVSILKFASALTFYIVNSLVGMCAARVLKCSGQLIIRKL